MIQVRELRIGNILGRGYYNPNPENNKTEIEPCYLVGILDKARVSLDLKGRDVLKYDYEYLEPIDLTEDWLLKFGFIKDQPEGWFYKQPIDILNQRFLLFKHKDLPYHYADGCFSPYLKYVHQLQNLYFALTGDELRVVH